MAPAEGQLGRPPFGLLRLRLLWVLTCRVYVTFSCHRCNEALPPGWATTVGSHCLMVWRPEAGIGVPAGAPLPPMPGPASAPRRHAAVSRVVCVSPRLTRPPVTESGSTPIQWDAILWEDSASRCGRHAGVGGEVSACLSGDAPRPPRGASARRTDAGTESAWPRDRAPFPEKLRTCSRRTCSRHRLPAPPVAPVRAPRVLARVPRGQPWFWPFRQACGGVSSGF